MNFIIIILAFFSICFSFLNPYIYYSSPRARRHPAELFVAISLTEIMCSYHLMIWGTSWDYFYIEFDIISLVRYFPIGQWSINQDKPTIIYKFCTYNQAMFCFCFSVQFYLYNVLAGDLLTTLTNPLAKLKWKWIFYVFSSLLIGFIFVTLYIDSIYSFCSLIKNENNIAEQFYNSFEPVIFFQVNNYNLFSFTQILIIMLILLTYYKIKKNLVQSEDEVEGNLQDLKKEYVYTQLFYLFIINVIWILPLFAILINNMIFQIISFYIILSQGIIIGLMRLREPYFKFRFKLLFKKMTRRVSIDDENQLSQYEQEGNQRVEPWLLKIQENIRQKQTEKIIKCTLLILQEQINKNIGMMNCQIDLKNILISSNFVRKQYRLQNLNDYSINNITQPLIEKKDKIEIIEIAPDIFNFLRYKNGLSSDIMMETLSIQKNMQALKKMQESKGRSGAFFFFSQDKKIIIKTLNKKEYHSLWLKILIPYTQYIIESENSLLSRIYGLYKVMIQGYKNVYVIVIENMFERLSKVDRVYDLKGSLKNRKGDTQNVMKDQDFLDSQDLFLKLHPLIGHQLLNQIKQDSTFLCSLGLMDYSILIGITDIDSSIYQPSQQNWRYFCQFNKVYCIGIIDYLQEFNLKKMLEFSIKSLSTNWQLISCIPPSSYKQRFDQFSQSILCSITSHD